MSLDFREIPSGGGFAQANRGREASGIRPSPDCRAADSVARGEIGVGQKLAGHVLLHDSM